MLIDADHRIRYGSTEEGRQWWECECGCGGSVPEFGDVEIASEKHVGEGETVVRVSGGYWP